MGKLLLTSLVAPAATSGRTPTELWPADLSWRGDRLTIGTPRTLPHDEGANVRSAGYLAGSDVVEGAIAGPVDVQCAAEGSASAPTSYRQAVAPDSHATVADGAALRDGRRTLGAHP